MVSVVFSKDRAFQLEATLRSFQIALAAAGESPPPTRVIYAASSEAHARSYRLLESEFFWVEFVKEKDFKSDVLGAVKGFDYVLFLVDDNIFVRPCSLTNTRRWLEQVPPAIGFSLRLGRNTEYCYTLNRSQALPKFERLAEGVLGFSWPGQEADFGYPLEVSSSVYRLADIRLLLEQLPYHHPNSMEGMISECARAYAEVRSVLLCPDLTISFCAPINRVQNVALNRAGEFHGRSAEELLSLFEQGIRLDVERYAGHVPGACHEEVPLFVRPIYASALTR